MCPLWFIVRLACSVKLASVRGDVPLLEGPAVNVVASQRIGQVVCSVPVSRRLLKRFGESEMEIYLFLPQLTDVKTVFINYLLRITISF